MDASEFGRSIPIGSLLLEPSPDGLVAASAELGYQARLAYRREARALGMKVLPAGSTLYFEGKAYPQPEEDLTVLLPGEEP